MRIALGSDHAGVLLKERILCLLRETGHEVEDLGTHGEESVDYPDYALAVARRVQSGEAERGILVCGTGNGMAMTANRVAGVRAALCHDRFTAEMSRKHNDANILCLGGRVIEPGRAGEIVTAWLEAKFEEGRHARRIRKIHELDRG